METVKKTVRSRLQIPFLSERVDVVELLDAGNHDHRELRGTFRDMRRVNSLLGGTAITLQGVERLAGHLSAGDRLSILDVGTGHADIPRSLQRWAQARGILLSGIGLDIDYATLQSMEHRSTGGSISFITGDGRDLPLGKGSVDIAISSMTLHHLDDTDGVVFLSEMARVARLGIVVNDLLRSVHGYAVAWLLARTFTRNRLTRNDAHRSIRRARTRHDMAQLARRAGLSAPVFDSTLGYRTAMTIGLRPW